MPKRVDWLKTTGQDKTLRQPAQFALLFWLAQILVIVFSWRSLPPQLPLFYSRPWGEEQLTTPLGLFTLPLVSLLIFLINLAFLLIVNKKERLIRQILITTVTVFNLFCLIALIQVIRLVI